MRFEHIAIRVLTVSALLLPGASAVQADVPEMVGFQGFLTDSNDTPVSAPGGLKMTFRLYHESEGGAPFWSDTYENVTVDAGVFFVLLGAGANPLPSLQLDGTIKYLGLSVSDGPELDPRLQLVSVPYAMRSDVAGTAIFAEEAGQLGGLSADDFAKASDVSGMTSTIESLQTEITQLKAQVELLAAQSGSGCLNECNPGEIGCSDDQSQTWECGEAGDGDPCTERLFAGCPGSLKCADGQCACAPNFTQVCIGDDAFAQDSCGTPGAMLASCEEGRCYQGACVTWQRETPLGLSGMNDIITIAGELYAVGNGGVVIHFDGTQWTRMASGTTKNLYAIWGYQNAGNVVLYAVGEKGKVIRLESGVWSTLLTGTYSDLYAVFGLGPNDIIIAGASRTILRWNGITWVPQDTSLVPDTTLRAAWGVSATKLWVGGNNGIIAQYDGTEWAPQDSGTGATIRDLWGISDQNIWAATSAGILRFQSSWQQQDPLNLGTINFFGLWGKNPGGNLTIYAVGNGGNIYTYDGVSWSPQGVVSSEVGSLAFRAVHGASGPATGVWVVSNEGTYLYHDPSGTWTFPAFNQTVRAIWGHAGGADTQWAVGSGCLALKYTGSQWLPSPIESGICAGGNGGTSFNGIWGTSTGSTIYAVGDSGLFKSWSGASWVDATGPNTANHEAIWGVDANNILVVQTANTHIWNGASWQNTGGGGGVAGWGTAITDFYVVDGSTATVKHFDGSEWTSVDLGGAALYDIWGTGPADVWVVGNSGNVFRFDGTEWVDNRIPADVLGAGAGANLRAVWATGLSPVYVSAGLGWTYKFDTSWSAQQLSQEPSLEAVFGLDGSNVVLGGTGAIFRAD